MGHLPLVEALADRIRAWHGLEYDPVSEVVVTSGASEAIASSVLGLVEPGDEVILIEPFYDSYPACVAMAGGVVRTCPLRPPRFELDLDALEALVSPRTRLLLFNSPHNPTGKVFTRDELEGIARICQKHGVTALSDEVYEHLTFGAARHISLASLPGMRSHTITVSSSGKTFSLTGWKVGWASGPANLIRAVQAAHQYVTFATCHAAARRPSPARSRRTGRSTWSLSARSTPPAGTSSSAALRSAGFEPSDPDGTYFILADYSKLSDEDDRAFARKLVEHHGVAAVPYSAFLAAPPRDRPSRLLRFAFCKRPETLEQAAGRLRAVRRS
jgi:N-succinyldiaminopimelate aminotransferase